MAIKRRYTSGDLEDLPDEKGNRYEIIDGVLVVEVLSPGARNEARDRHAKLGLYSRQGVLEYWIVDWRARAVEVYRRDGDGLRLTVRLSGNDVLTTPLLDGFACPLSELWAPEL